MARERGPKAAVHSMPSLTNYWAPNFNQGFKHVFKPTRQLTIYGVSR